jgi:nucleoid-associated protein YgaU
MGLRYGLLAALTLVLASALLWDRLHPPKENRLFPRDEPAAADLALLVVGGRPEPLPPAPRPGARPPQEAAGGPYAAPEEETPASEESEVVVEKGDSLGAIAQRTMGSSRKAAELARYNGMSLDSPIREGQVLRVPPAAPAAAASSTAPRTAAAPKSPGAAPAPSADHDRSHRVEKGDTLFALAKRFYGDGSQFRRIADANGLDPEEPLRAGRELRIP